MKILTPKGQVLDDHKVQMLFMHRYMLIWKKKKKSATPGASTQTLGNRSTSTYASS